MRTPPADEPGTVPTGPGTASPWLEWTPGMRVMVRRTLHDDSHLYTDVLGTVLSNDAAGLRLLTRSGEVLVPVAEIAVGKPIPPAPERRNRRTGSE